MTFRSASDAFRDVPIQWEIWEEWPLKQPVDREIRYLVGTDLQQIEAYLEERIEEGFRIIGSRLESRPYRIVAIVFLEKQKKAGD